MNYILHYTFFYKGLDLCMIAYRDVDWGGDLDDHKSNCSSA